MTSDVVSKYDRIAEGFAEVSYANLEFYMRRRFLIATSWGPTLRAGDSLLELGCGDGYLAQLFVAQGLHYCGVDISPKMVATAQHRLFNAGLSANFTVMDASRMILSDPVDALVSYMRAFFTYISNPLDVLRQFRPYVRKKIIIDLEPRPDLGERESRSYALLRARFQTADYSR